MISGFEKGNEEASKIDIHCKTSSWNKTIFDTHVNMLRNTTEAMSAAIGGCNSLTVIPFDEPVGESDTFSLRISRNVQLILKEESRFDKVVDPGAGSYYIEKATESIANEAWKLFLEIEAKGGIIEAAKQGFVNEQIAAVRAKRDKMIEGNRDNYVGSNHVAIPNSMKVKVEKDPQEKIIYNSPVSNTADITVEKLKIERAVRSFELLREKTEAIAAEKGHFPVCFLAKYGNFTMRKARGEFAYNFLSEAGFDISDNNGFASIDAAVDAAVESQAEFVVICSSDDDYKESAVEFTKKLKEKSSDKLAGVILAGNPVDIIDDLKAVGVNEFIHLKANALKVLTNLQNRL